MRKDYQIVVGDKVDLFVGTGRFFRTMVEDIVEDEQLLVGVPSYAGMTWDLREGQDLYLAFYRDSGMYVAGVKLVAYRMLRSIRFMLLKITSAPIKQQRRGYFRLPVSRRAEILQDIQQQQSLKLDTKDAEETVLESVRTVNISISGIGLRAKGGYTIGDRIRLRVYFGWPRDATPPVELIGEIKRVVPESGTDFKHVGIHFIKPAENVSEYIAKFILNEQQKQIRQKRLIEGD